MYNSSYFPIEAWWQIHSYDLHEHVEPRQRWWWNNRERNPPGLALLQYILRGRIAYRDGNGTREVSAGSAILVVTGEDTSYGFTATPHEPLETLWISFSGTGLAEHWNAIRARFGSVVKLDDKCGALEFARNICGQPRPRNPAEVVQRSLDVYALFRQLYVYLENGSRIGQSRVERAVSEILSCADGNVSVKELVRRHGCSREHFTRVFSQQQGISPAHYLARGRLARATTLLKETRLSIAEIARQSGFGSRQALIRWMRREAGCVPKQVRVQS